MNLNTELYNHCKPRDRQGQNRAKKPGSTYRPTGIRAPHHEPTKAAAK